MRFIGVIRFLVVLLVIVPTLQAGATLAASTPDVGITHAAHIAPGAPGERSTKNAAAFGAESGQFAVNGHTGSPGRLTPSFVQKLRKSAGALPGSTPARHVVQLGVIRLVGARTLELSRPSLSSLKSGSRLLYSMSVESFRSHVSVSRSAWLQLRNRQGHLTLQRATNLKQLHAGIDVLVAGDVVAGTLRARVISTLAGATVHRIPPGLVNLGDTTAGRRPVLHSTSTPDFGGTSQLGNYSWVHDFNNTLIFTIGIVEIKLQKVTFTAGLGGAFYRWPFQFSAVPRGPLVMGQPTPVDVQVTPQKRSDGGYTLNFTSGVDAGIGLYVWIALGCGFLGTSSCKYFPQPHVGFGLSLSTSSAAPMSGSSVKLDANSCPTLPIFAIPIVNWGLVLKACLSIVVKGSSFRADLSASGAQIAGKTHFAFDGNTPYSVTLTPTAPQVNLTFGIFGYYTTWDVGLEPIISLNPFGVKYSFGSLVFVSDQRKDWIGSPINQAIQLIFPLNQPSEVSFPFSVGNQSSGGYQGAGGTGTSSIQLVTLVTAANGGLSDVVQVTFSSTTAGQGMVLFGTGPGCTGLVQIATQDQGAGTTNHTVTVTGNDMPGTVGDVGIQPGMTYYFEVETVSSSGTEVDNNGGTCYSVTIPAS